MNKVNNIQGLSYVNPEGIVPFENNPFEVRDDEEMKSLVESIREYGILTPLVVSRQGRRGDVIQLVSGHRRLHAAKELGLQVIPVSYLTMTPAEIEIAVVDSNLQREHILPSEKAAMEQCSHSSDIVPPKKSQTNTDSHTRNIVPPFRTQVNSVHFYF